MLGDNQKSFQEYQMLYKKLFKKMGEHSRDVQVYPYFYGALIAIMKSVEKSNESQDKLNILKREFLSNLFKLPFYLQNLEYYKCFLELKTKQEEQELINLEFYACNEAITLTVNIIKNYQLGII
jgi:hypothetical protein